MLNRLMRGVCGFVSSIAFTCAISASELKPEAKAEVKFYYEAFPPYIYSDKGSITGSVIALTQPILRDAGLKVTWQEATFSRILRDLDRTDVLVCAAGYSAKSVEDPAFYASEPYAWIADVNLMILRTNRHMFEPHVSIADVMSDTRLRGGFLNDANYLGISGAPIEAGRERHILIGGSDTDLANLIVRERIHFAPVTAPQVAYFKARNDRFGNLEIHRVSGLRRPRSVGLVCSKSIGETVWNRIEQNIPALLPYDEYLALYMPKWGQLDN